MLKSESLDPLYSILRDMTLVERRSAVAEPVTKMQLLEKFSLRAYFVVMVLFLVAVLAQRVWSTQVLVESVEILYLFFLFVVLVYLLSATFNAGLIFWRGYKQPFPWLLSPMQLDMGTDADYVNRLVTFDKPTLSYALLQYRYHFDVQEGRVSSLAGDLRKLGLFPAIAASAVAASTLAKNDGNLIWWAPLILAACFYFMAFVVHAQRERPQQVIKLLELAIEHAEVNATTTLQDCQETRLLEGG